MTDKDVRIDKYLWAVRLFKTRSLATEACKKGKVWIDESPVKPSRNVKIGEIIKIKRPPLEYSYQVTGILEKRQAAKIVVDYVTDITPQSELDKLKVNETFFVQRDRGAGRPTKKQRRDIDKLQGWDDFK